MSASKKPNCAIIALAESSRQLRDSHTSVSGAIIRGALEFIAAQLHLKSDVAPAIQKWTKDQIAAHFPSSNLDKLVGSVNMIVQGLNAVVTFICSKFVRKKLTAVADANGTWHWVSTVRARNESRILRVKLGRMTITRVDEDEQRAGSPAKVIHGTDLEIDGRKVDQPSNFQATDVMVGTLETDRIIFSYVYSDGERGISNLSLWRETNPGPWPLRVVKRAKAKIVEMTDSFWPEDLVGKGEARYFKSEKVARKWYEDACRERNQESRTV